MNLSNYDMFDQDCDQKQMNLYDIHWRSVLRSFQQCVQEIKELGLSENIEVINLDDHANIYDLPEKDCIMLSGFNSYTDEKTIGFGWFVGVSTFSDATGHRLSKIISYLFSRYYPGRAIRIVDENLNVVAKLITTNGTEVMPISAEKNRAIQFVSVMALSTSVLV